MGKKSDVVVTVENVAIASLKVGTSIAYGFFPMLLMFAQTLLVLIGLAVLFIVLRILILDLAPSFSNHARVWAGVANGFIDTLVVVIDAIKVAINVLQNVAAAFSGGQPKAMPDLSFPPQIDAAQVIEFSNTLVTECVPMNNIGSMMSHLVKQGLHSSVCPVLRAAVPVRGANAILDPLLSWASYDYRPMPVGDNCKYPDPMAPKIYCIGLGTGIIMAELLIPLLLICLLIFNSGAALALLLGGLLHLVSLILTYVEKAALYVPRLFYLTKENHEDSSYSESDETNVQSKLLF